MSKKVKMTVVVLGLRSGTSLTAGILKILGVNMGRKMLAANEYNKKGFFENLEIVDLNNRILRYLGATIKRPPRWRIRKPLTIQLRRDIEQVIDNAEDAQWGFKDPRAIFTIQYLYPYLKNPRFIVCRRNREDVGRSLEKSFNVPLKEGTRLAARCDREINEFLNEYGIEPLEIDFTDYFKKPNETIEAIAKYVNLPINGQRESILNFIDPSLVTASQRSKVD